MTSKDAIKAGAWTAVFTFVALFGLSLLGWLNDVLTWATSSSTDVVVFPDPTVLVKAAAGAAVAAVSGLVNTVVRLVQAKLGSGGPQYPST